MNTKFKPILYSLILAGLVQVVPVCATDTGVVEVINSGATSVPAVVVDTPAEGLVAVPAIPAVDDSKGKGEAVSVDIEKVEIAPAGPTNPMVVIGGKEINVLEAMKQMTSFMDALKSFRQVIKNGQGLDAQANEAAIIKNLFYQDGLVVESASLLNTLINGSNKLIQEIPAKEGTGCYNCKAVWNKVAIGSAYGVEEFKTLMPMVDKYYYLVKTIQSSGDTDALSVFSTLLQSGAQKDLDYLFGFVDRYNAFSAEQKALPEPVQKLNKAHHAAENAKYQMRVAKAAAEKAQATMLMNNAKAEISNAKLALNEHNNQAKAAAKLAAKVQPTVKPVVVAVEEKK